MNTWSGICSQAFQGESKDSVAGVLSSSHVIPHVMSCRDVNADEGQGKIYYRNVEDVVISLLQDPRFLGHIDYHFKPIFQGGKRVWGPYNSALQWQELETLYPDKTIIPVVCYSDATEFYKGASAHPTLGMLICILYMFCIYRTCMCCLLCVSVYSHTLCAVTLGNIRENMRFRNVAWRLLQLMPANLKYIKTSLDKVKLWHLSAGLSFQNYNEQNETGTLVECSDGKVRDCVFILCQWQSDQPEADCCNCSIQVRFCVYMC